MRIARHDSADPARALRLGGRVVLLSGLVLLTVGMWFPWCATYAPTGEHRLLFPWQSFSRWYGSPFYSLEQMLLWSAVVALLIGVVLVATHAWRVCLALVGALAGILTYRTDIGLPVPDLSVGTLVANGHLVASWGSIFTMSTATAAVACGLVVARLAPQRRIGVRMAAIGLAAVGAWWVTMALTSHVGDLLVVTWLWELRDGSSVPEFLVPVVVVAMALRLRRGPLSWKELAAVAGLAATAICWKAMAAAHVSGYMAFGVDQPLLFSVVNSLHLAVLVHGAMFVVGGSICDLVLFAIARNKRARVRFASPVEPGPTANASEPDRP